MTKSDWSIPAVWMGAWGKSEMLKLLARVPYVERRAQVVFGRLEILLGGPVSHLFRRILFLLRYGAS